ncbi:MAG: ATP-binding protein [Clostridiales bacterium]|nr:ATP-binding protein [Clostridiales bacterium]
MKLDVLSESVLTKLFTPNKSNPNYIHGRESTTIEYKESYNHGSMARYFKTMAAFANTEGGYIIFGIGDSPREFLGLSDKSRNLFDNIKIEEFTYNLNEYFQPEIKWQHVLFDYRNRSYGIIYTFPLTNKPCICSKMYDFKDDRKYSLEEGDIYYRYRGRSQKIKYAELRNIFIQAAEQESQKWRNLIEQTAKIGISNASLLNLNTGEMNIDNSTILMDKELVEKINFIKEGRFVEKRGAPTLKLIGEIKNINTFDGKKINGVVFTTPRLRAIEQEDIVKAFLKNTRVEAPLEFIKVIVNCSSGFQPIYFYIKQSQSEVEDIIDDINDNGKITKTKKMIIQRLSGRREEQQTAQKNDSESSQSKYKYLQKWIDKQLDDIIVELNSDNQDCWFLQSFLMLDSKVIIENSEYYKNILFDLYENKYKQASSKVSDYFRRVLCRLDEVLYFEQNN